MKKLYLSITLCVFIFFQVCYAETYNLANDFSSVSNPNNEWSYGFSNIRDTNYKLLNRIENFNGYSDEIVWWISNNALPSVFHNPTNKVIHFSTVSISPHSAAFHPGPNGEKAVIRWTAPDDGNYLIHAVAKGIDHVHPTTSKVSILHNNQLIWSVLINDYNKPYSFSNKVILSLGDSIDFSCGFGSNGNYYGDSTAIDITIKKLDECDVSDSDKDGVIDIWDNCPKTPLNSYVNSKGCPLIDNSALSGQVLIKGLPLTDGNATLFQSGELFQKTSLDNNGWYKFKNVSEEKSINIMIRKPAE